MSLILAIQASGNLLKRRLISEFLASMAGTFARNLCSSSIAIHSYCLEVLLENGCFCE
jgi:hypothetical protein